MVQSNSLGRQGFLNEFNDLAEVADGWVVAAASTSAASGILSDAIYYTLSSSGKRLRPVIAMAAASLLGVRQADVHSFAVALELIHTASLIHDDLPALDNDSTRRGQDACHVRFGEPIAILAGDALIAGAFANIAGDEAVPKEVRVAWTQELGQAVVALCEGQAMEFEHRPEREMTPSELELCYRKKTGALFAAALAGPSYLSSLGAERQTDLRKYGEMLGLLFQITDDILDAGAEESRTERNLVSLIGIEAARDAATAASLRAAQALDHFEEASFFLELLEYVRTRER